MTVFSVNLTGGGPWGIRLIGGHNDPLLIARIRKRSKAEDAGLLENDELVTINGQPCSSMSHATAMAMLENSSHLTLDLSRGGAAPVAAPSMGPPASSTSSVTLQLQTPHAGGMYNGDTTVNTTTSTQQFGSTTVTKVKREVTTNWGPHVQVVDSQPQPPQGLYSPAPSPHGALSPRGAASPYQVPSPRQLLSPGPSSAGPPQNQMISPSTAQDAYSQPGMYKNPTPRKFGGPGEAPKPAMWQPSGASQPAVPPQQQNGTMSYPAAVPPPQKPLPSIGPKFSVRNMADVTTQQPYSTWAPGGQGGAPRVQPRAMSPPRDEPIASGAAVWQPPKATFKDIVDTGPKHNFTIDSRNNNVDSSYQNQNMYSDMPDSPIYDSDLHYPENPDVLPSIDVNRLIREGSSDEGSRSDTPTRKKKIYADSAFYDDPQHKYPTIEEQIKMARKVAMSLTAPANKRARGAQMFTKRQERSENWIAGAKGEQEMEIYYNPDPWKNRTGPHTWQPEVRPSPTPSFGSGYPSGYIPPAPSLDHFMAPSYEDSKKKDEKTLSAEEFERMRLYEQKNLHNTVSPQVCFNLAHDLRSMKGKAGQMFAKRRAKADEHIVDESNVRTGPDPKILAKLMEGKAPPAAAKKDHPDSKADKLAEMVAKPAMSPWEAALRTGGSTLDPAFSHLNTGWTPPGFGAPVPDKFAGGVTPSQLEKGGGLSKLDCQDFNRRARGWGGAGAPMPANYNMQQPAAAAQPAQWQGAGAAGGQWQQPPSAMPTQHHGAEPAGFSDL